MSWQTPGKDGPPEQAGDRGQPKWPEPDAETTRVPIGSEPDPVPPAPPVATPLEPPAEPPPPPATGLISADPVGWSGPTQDPVAAPHAGGPEVAWAPPVAAAATPVTAGLVISGTFSRLVAYSVDVLLLGLVTLAVSAAVGVYGAERDQTLSLLVTGFFIVVDFIYFVGFWRSRWHATLGMRLLRLQVLDHGTAGSMSLNDALLRWLALSGAISIIGIVPGAAGYVGWVAILWYLALLLTTAMNPLHQGLHDRWARTVVVQPAPGGSGAAVVTCLVVAVGLFIILPIGLVAVFGDQIEEILLEIGRSV